MTSQHGAYVLHGALARLTYTLSLPHAEIRVCNTFCFTSATMIRERASVLLYTYNDCIVHNNYCEQYRPEIRAAQRKHFCAELL